MGRPVEIEFLMRDKLTAGVYRAGQSVDTLGDQTDITTRKIREMANTVESEGSRMGRTLKTVLSGAAIGSFIKKIYEVRSELQDTESTMRVFLGSAEKGAQFMKELQDYAWFNMFEFSDLAKQSASLLAFGNDVGTVIPILDKLSNIAAGTKRPLSEVVDLYNKAKNMGKVEADGLESWARQGLVITDILDEMGVQVDRSAIKFEHLDMAISHVTGEGGRFHNLMGEQMQNLSASWGQLQDDLTTMFNEIGQKTEGIMKGAIETGSLLIDNYEDIGKTIAVLVTAYGTYKAALITTAAVESAMNNMRYTYELEELSKLLPVKEQAVNSDIAAAVASGRLSAVKAEQIIAIRAELAAKLDELKVNQALAMSEQATAYAAHKAALQRALNAKTMVAQREMELSLARMSGNAAQVELAEKALLEAQEERHIAVKARKATADTLSIAKSKTAAATTAVETLQTKINTAGTIAAAKAKNILTLATTKLTAAMRSLKVAFASNPVGLILTVLTTAIMATTLFSSKTAEATEEVLGLARAQRKAGEEYDSEASKIKALTDILNNSNVVYDDRKKALDQLRVIIPDYNAKLTDEGTIINNNTEAIKEYLTQLERQIKLKSAQEELEEAYKQKRALEKQEAQQSDKYWDIRQTNTLQGYNRDGVTAKISRAFGMESEDNAKKALDETQRQLREVDHIIGELNGEIATTSTTVSGTTAPVKSFTDQLKSTGDRVTTLKQELKDLRAGKGSEKDFAKAIEDKKKELDSAEKRYNLMLGIDKSTIKAGKDANHTKVEAAERARQIEEYGRKVAQQVKQAELEIAQVTIDAQEDGAEKQLAQINHNYDKLIQQNKDREAEMLAELQKAERLRWENEHPDFKDKGLVFTPTSTAADLSTDQIRILKEYTAAANKYKEKAESDLLKDAARKYETYEQERLRIAKEYDDQIALLKKNNKNGQYDENIRQAEKEKNGAIAGLDATMQATSDFWGQLFDTFSDYTNRELETIIANAQEVLDYINTTPTGEIQPKFGLTAEQLINLKGNAQELTAVYDALGKKVLQLNKRNPFGAMIRSAQMLRKNTAAITQAQEELSDAQKSGDKTAIKNAKDKVDGLKRQEKLLKGTLKEAAKSAAAYLGDVGSSLEQIGAAAGDAGLESMGKTLGDVAGIAEQFASGDYIGAAMNAVVTGITAIVSSNAKYRAALKQMRDDQIAFAHEYKLVMSDIRLEAEEASNAFSDDAFAKAIAALKELHSNYEDFIKLVNKDDNIRSTTSGTGFFAALKRAQLDAKGITTDLQNIWVQTRHSTWFRSAKGFYLKDKYPELFEGEHGFNVEAARVLLETNNQLNDEAKRQIQEVIDIYDQWKEAEEAFKDYLSDTFGEIGNSLGDSIVDAFKNGTDAMEGWGKSFSNVLENLGKQLMQTIFLQKHFDKLEDDLLGLYENYGDDPNLLGKKVQDLMGNFFKGMAGTIQQAEQWYESWASEAAKHGFDLSGQDEGGTQQSGKAGAFQTMSQDQGTKLEGLFTSLQGHAISIDDKLDDIGSGIYGIGEKLAKIDENTKRSADRLDEVAEDIKVIKRDGLKMK